MKITYQDEDLEPTGERGRSSGDAVVDDVLKTLDVAAKIDLGGKFRYVSGLEVVNLLDLCQKGKKVDPWHISLEVDIPQIQINSMWFPFSLFYTLVQRKRQELGQLLGAELKQVKGFVDLAPGEGIFGWLNFDSPSFFVSRPIDAAFTYKEFVQLVRRLDSWIAEIVDQVLRLSDSVQSCEPPDYERNTLAVFVCHSSRDKAFARKLSAALRDKSVDVWLDEDKMNVGEDFVSQLEKGITESDFVAVILSPNFVKFGPWAKEEFRIALSEQIEKRTVRILPILKKDCQIPQILKTKHYADFRRAFDEGMEKLLTSMRRLKARHQRPQQQDQFDK